MKITDITDKVQELTINMNEGAIELASQFSQLEPYQQAAPVVGGILLYQIAKKSPILLGFGMIALEKMIGYDSNNVSYR